mmetsp:Transcript_39368/g.85861  ORF Transcript_39368/g.85861 Transcript_39368/m.85861 type:complete len:256 (+) Transcript_39368:206-973(+)
MIPGGYSCSWSIPTCLWCDAPNREPALQLVSVLGAPQQPGSPSWPSGSDASPVFSQSEQSADGSSPRLIPLAFPAEGVEYLMRPSSQSHPLQPSTPAASQRSPTLTLSPRRMPTQPRFLCHATDWIAPQSSPQPRPASHQKLRPLAQPPQRLPAQAVQGLRETLPATPHATWTCAKESEGHHPSIADTHQPTLPTPEYVRKEALRYPHAVCRATLDSTSSAHQWPNPESPEKCLVAKSNASAIGWERSTASSTSR